MPESKEKARTRVELRSVLVWACKEQGITLSSEKADFILREVLYALATKISVYPFETMYFLRRYL